MAIGVFIAPILLYWEALSSFGLKIAVLRRAPHSVATLTDPKISTLAAVRSFDQKRPFFDAKQLIVVDRARRNSSQNIADVIVRQNIALHRPPPLEFGYKLGSEVHLARESAIWPEGVKTTLSVVGVPPFAH